MFAHLAGNTYQKSSCIKCTNRFSTLLHLFTATISTFMGESGAEAVEYAQWFLDPNCSIVWVSCILNVKSYFCNLNSKRKMTESL